MIATEFPLDSELRESSELREWLRANCPLVFARIERPRRRDESRRVTPRRACRAGGRDDVTSLPKGRHVVSPSRRTCD